MEETVSITDIMQQLSALNEFDLPIVASLIAGYLLFFSLGFIAGTVIKIMKRA